MSCELKTMSDNKIKIMLWSVTFVFFAIMGLQLNITIVVDEPGTIANAAWLAGNDWNSCIQGIGGYYYKYGTALFYYPLYLIFKDSYIFYKAVMLLHGAFLSFVPVIVYDILRRYLHIEEKLLAALISVTLGIFPSTMLYSMYARADALLILIPWIVCLLLLESNKAYVNQNKKTWILFTILISFASFYGYACHTRGIVFVIAVFCTVFAGEFFCKIKIVNWPIYLVMNVFLYFSDKLTTAYFKDSVWYGLTKLHASTDRFKFFKLKEIFTTEHGFKSFVKLVIGWAFNLLTSTYGLILIGFLFSIIVIWYAFRKKKREHFSVAERIVAAFGTLLFLGSYAQGCLFFYSPADRIFQGKVHVRLDRLIYGRYMACAIGILVLLALYILIFKSDLFKWKIKASCVAVHIGVLIFFFGVVMKYLADGEAAVRYFMELSTFLKLPSKRQTMGDFDQLDEALLAAAILGLLVSCIIFVFSVRNMKVKTALCTFVLILTGVLTSVNFYNVRLARDQYMTGKITPVKNYIIDMGDLYEDYPVLCTDKKAATIGTYQLPLRNYKLVETENKLALETDNMLIITRENKISEELMENDIYYFADYPYNPNEDVPYVKGKELKNRLTELGYDLIKY